MAPVTRTPLTARAVISHVAVILAVSVVLGVLVAGLAIPWAGVVGTGGQALADRVEELPEALEEQPLSERSRVLDRHGKLIATFYDENRINVPLRDVAPIMQDAIIAIEDARFYQHGAIDLKGTLRAFLTNATRNTTQGGSTITQQLAKQTLVDQASGKAEREMATEDTYARKLRELRHAIAFEQNYSKEWILERYLNIAYFGDGAYGIQAAARHYFGKNARDLDLRESALLAGLVRNPVGYDPTRFPDRATARRNTVLMRLADTGKITEAQARETQATKLGLRIRPMRNGCLGSPAPFFCDYVRRYLLADPALGRTVSERQQLIDNGGLTIKTTVDLEYQAAADSSTRAHVAPTDNAIGALAMIEPGTGEVRAISQSRPMGRMQKKGQTFLNYVVDEKLGDANGFQAGSTFKVFVLASALEQGLPTSTRFHAPEKISIPQNEFETCDGPYPVSAPWEPSNSTGSGSFDMYSGTQKSVNTYFAQLTKETGICKPYALARSMGVQLDNPDDERVPSFVLGVADVSPVEMAEAYATFAARGLHCDSRPVTSILNADGRLFKRYPKSCQQVMQQNTADTVNNILRGVMEPGGFGQNLAIDQPAAGKTGTINSNMAVWFVGYTANMATASMIAGANQKGHWVTLNGQSLNGRFVSTAFGSTVAGPMWEDAMAAIDHLLPNVDFNRPTGIDNVNPGASIVPNVAGMTVDEATTILRDAGFSARVGAPVTAELEKGRIVLTSPATGATAYDGTTVTLFPSAGPPPAPATPEEDEGDGDGDNDGPGGGNGNGNGGGNGND